MTVQNHGDWRLASDGWSWIVQRAQQPDSCESELVWETRASCADLEDALGWLKWLRIREFTGPPATNEPSSASEKHAA